MISRLPLRLRLTLWYGLGFAIGFMCIGGCSLWMVHRAIVELENNELQQRVKSVRRFLDARPPGETSAQTHDAMRAAYDVMHGTKWLQIIDQNGFWLYRNSHVAEVYPHLTLPQNMVAQEDYFTYADGDRYVRALVAPLKVRGVSYTVQTGVTMNRTLAILSSLNYQLGLLTIAGLVLSSLAGYFMSRKALTPIAAIAREAQRINDRNLNLRLPVLESRDELAALSGTLNQMLERVEAGYQSVRSFTANAAHELRTPVALLRAEADLALSFPRDADYYRRVCESTRSNALQMSRLIDQLLALARADGGVEVLKPEILNVPDLLEELTAQWTSTFAEAGISLECRIDDLETWVSADYGSIKQLVHILMENAWRYTPTFGSVTVTCSRSPQSTQRDVRIAVSDTGVGISLKDQCRVFERFCRLAQPLHGEFAGCGLGLPLAQSIAERHGSTVRVESTPGVGSSFSFDLPLYTGAMERPHNMEAMVPGQPSGSGLV